MYLLVNDACTRIYMEQFYDDIERAMANSDPNYKIRETEREVKYTEASKIVKKEVQKKAQERN